MKKLLVLATTCILLLLFLLACRQADEAVMLEATRPPTRLPVTATPDPASLMLLQQQQSVLPTPTSLPSPTAVPPEATPTPEVDRLNNWLNIVPPAGWQRWEGIDGVTVSQHEDMNSFLIIRRWNNPLTIQDWIAYLPDGIAERDSYVTVRIGERDWDGVFVSSAEETWRAFFAVTGNVPSYSIMVYVPAGFDLAGGDLATHWYRAAGDYNALLYTISIAD